MGAKIHVFRVMPDKELLSSVKAFCESKGIKSGIITGIIGSLKTAKLGFLKELPGKYITKEFKGPLEIVAAQGSIALCDSELIIHIHMLISDDHQAIGGHLSEAQVFSTAEVVIQELDQQLVRKKDEHTGLNEIES
jgi:predicted DNA-binding protein with PD1-like motif